MSSAIENIEIRKILDSRGNATVEIDITTESGFGRVAAPSGASTGALEVVAFPEAGIDKLINAFPERVKPELVGINAEEIVLVDDILKRSMVLTTYLL
ncbi:hypothetical protein GCM10025861_18970 [Methanobacterium petrolearium]|nr:hypothetical protein GCM10025861_18970 [Methanobacterium petrolearium]